MLILYFSLPAAMYSLRNAHLASNGILRPIYFICFSTETEAPWTVTVNTWEKGYVHITDFPCHFCK